jgi:NAD(P)-dependent dehydrogenase (short-subunit alcohol dehydrogenase family)
MPARLGSLTDQHVDYHLNTHIKGMIWTVQKALPLMGPGSSIILNASIIASKSWANWSVYSASKAAVRTFARTWSSDLRRRGIRVNVISPGVIPTLAQEDAAGSLDVINGFMEHAASITPLDRTGTEEKIARAVAFHASNDTSFIAASEIFVDKGIAQV